MLGGIAAAVAILLFVTAHEAGHFFAAKGVGMKATQFFFGFGPRIWSTKRGETEYGIKALPLGGYVRIIGMNPLEEVAPEDMGRTYREKKFWEKSVVVLAGVGMNFLIAFLMFYGIFVANGVTEPVPVINTVVSESPASDAGLEEGDIILSIAGQSIATWDDLTAVLAEGARQVDVLVDRGGQTLTVTVDLAESDTRPRSGYLGVAPEVEEIAIGPIEGIGLAGQAVWGGIEDTFFSLYQMFRPSSLAQYLGVLGG